MFERKISKRKSGRTLLTIVLALALCLGSFTAVFAADPPKSGGTKDNPAQATIEKVLNVPQGTELPAGGVGFTFNVTSVSVDEVAGTASNMPKIDAKDITIAPATANSSNANITAYTKESGDIFAGANFPHAGVYIYTVTEQDNSYTTGTIAGWDEKLTYSPAEYTLRVIVKQEGAVNFIESITAQIKTKDNDGQTENTKVDPTPGASDIMFTNTYTKTKIVTDPVNESILNIGMTAAGGYANTSLYFPVSVTVTKSALETATSYKAYVVEGSTIVNDAEVGTASGTDGNGKSYYDFTSGAAKSLKLKHGQKLAFVDVSVGTTWTATDTLGSDVPYSLYTASGTANDVQLATVSKGESLSTGNLLVIETGSIAAFTNTREVVSPTGIIINNLPYIGLIVLALGAFAVFIAAGIRRRSREQAYN